MSIYHPQKRLKYSCLSLCLRRDEINVTDYYQYEEENEDVLAREPFIVMFECPNTGMYVYMIFASDQSDLVLPFQDKHLNPFTMI